MEMLKFRKLSENGSLSGFSSSLCALSLLLPCLTVNPARESRAVAASAHRSVFDTYALFRRCSRRNAFKNKGIFGQDGELLLPLRCVAELAN